MKAFMEQKGIVPSFIYSSEAQDAPEATASIWASKPFWSTPSVRS